MNLIVGLGNPGEKYVHTRHNLGARVVAAFVQKMGEDALKQQGIAWLLPTVNMNDSGTPVADYLRQLPLEPSQVLLVHDDLELPLGEIKFQPGGSARGHKGVRSVHEKLGTTEIPRLRLGIGRPATGDVFDYVLENFTEEEEAIVEQVVEKAVQWLVDHLTRLADGEATSPS